MNELRQCHIDYMNILIEKAKLHYTNPSIILYSDGGCSLEYEISESTIIGDFFDSVLELEAKLE